MPQYEYRCALGHSFDLRRGIDQRDDPAHCPQCGGQGLRLISGFGIKQGITIKPSVRPAGQAAWTSEPPQGERQGP